MYKNGFTLLQLLLAVVIIGILAGISIPNYNKAKERALGKIARANLKLMAAAEKVYKMDYGVYRGCPCENIDECNEPVGCNTVLRLNLDTESWTYAAQSLGPANFRVRAYRGGTGGSGYLGCWYELMGDSDTGEPEPSDPGECP